MSDAEEAASDSKGSDENQLQIDAKSTNTSSSDQTQTTESSQNDEIPKVAKSKPKTDKGSKGEKVDVLLKATGDAPILKTKKWAVFRTKKISWVCEFIKKLMKLDRSDSLFFYVNQTFSPSPDTEVGVLFDCFGSDGKLVLHYCLTQAWG
ncbi:ubiquitin-like protein ATG12 isoform X1 [Gigantopelta aegis]|uniref:ubiquitin-like protein ATG12 isoform X1 n=1 Tax=Gigantopelta aegis TaxID=1735272 RepID=UPI001B88B545|nr:ubiquitin-like protein ATG12 isoform X1 [Gigantopelta aegis]